MSVLPYNGRKSGLEIVSTSYSQKKPFLGVIICGTGFSREARKQVQITTERLGGQYSRDLHLNCTHLVVLNCSGRKYEHAVKHGVYRGLHIVSLSWFEDCIKQNARLDESLYTVSSTRHQVGTILEHPEYSPEEVEGATLSENYAAGHLQKKPLTSLLRNSSNLSKPQASPALENSSSLAGARFYIDPDLRRDLKLKAKESAESWGATCVGNWSKATHVVCDSASISKYIGLNLHLVSPMWVMSARDGLPLRCVQYSADLARDVGTLLSKHNNTKNHVLKDEGITLTASEKVLPLREREKKALDAKAGVRRRRGPHMQSWRTRPRVQMPASLLEPIYWIVTDIPTVAQMYTKSSSFRETRHNCRYQDHYEAFEDNNIYTKPLSQREKREVVFPGSFLTILFPIDRFSELGPSSRTFFSDAGFTRAQIIHLVYSFYQEPLDDGEVEATMHTDSKHGDCLRTHLTHPMNSMMMPRHQLLGSRVQFQGLQRSHSIDPFSHIYDLCLGTTATITSSK